MKLIGNDTTTIKTMCIYNIKIPRPLLVTQYSLKYFKYLHLLLQSHNNVGTNNILGCKIYEQIKLLHNLHNFISKLINN